MYMLLFKSLHNKKNKERKSTKYRDIIFCQYRTSLINSQESQKTLHFEAGEFTSTSIPSMIETLTLVVENICQGMRTFCLTVSLIATNMMTQQAKHKTYM